MEAHHCIFTSSKSDGMKIWLFFFFVLALLISVTTLTAQTGCTGSATINVVIEDCTATQNIPGLSRFDISPNPAGDFLLLQVETLTNISGYVSLIHASGSLILQEAVEWNGLYQRSFDISTLPSGTYWLVLRHENRAFSRKVIVE